MNKSSKIILLGILILFINQLYSQERKYLYGGIRMTSYSQTQAFQLIFDDYNNFHTSNDQIYEHKLTLPTYILGYSIGTKINSRNSEFGGNVNFNHYSVVTHGNDSSGTPYYKKLTVSQDGFCLHYTFNFINTNYFRTGPGIAFKLEQYKIKLHFDETSTIIPELPISKALISGLVNYSISFGGPKLNIDIVAFYQIPFWKIELSRLNTSINQGYETSYTQVQSDFNPISYGISFLIGLGSKENYDF